MRLWKVGCTALSFGVMLTTYCANADETLDNPIQGLARQHMKESLEHPKGNPTPSEDLPIRASILDDISTVERLLDTNVNQNCKALDGSTPLTHASFRGNADVVQALLAYHADPDLEAISATRH